MNREKSNEILLLELHLTTRGVFMDLWYDTVELKSCRNVSTNSGLTEEMLTAHCTEDSPTEAGFV